MNFLSSYKLHKLSYHNLDRNKFIAFLPQMGNVLSNRVYLVCPHIISIVWICRAKKKTNER